MNLRSDRELANTKRKLNLLEELYAQSSAETDEDEYGRELELSSIKRLINQLKEEIARYEAHHLPARR